MAATNTRLTAAVEAYFADLRRVRASGGATGERSSYGPLAGLLNAVGATLKPKAFCVLELADQGAGHHDFGLYTARQGQRGQPREGQAPERGVRFTPVRGASNMRSSNDCEGRRGMVLHPGGAGGLSVLATVVAAAFATPARGRRG